MVCIGIFRHIYIAMQWYGLLLVSEIHIYMCRWGWLLPLAGLCRLEEEIGSGQFGTVYRAKWEFSISDTEAQNAGSQVISAHVAVKVMSSTTSQEDRIKFLQEAVLLAQFNDPNIVAVFGVITNNDKVWGTMHVCKLCILYSLFDLELAFIYHNYIMYLCRVYLRTCTHTNKQPNLLSHIIGYTFIRHHAHALCLYVSFVFLV